MISRKIRRKVSKVLLANIIMLNVVTTVPGNIPVNTVIKEKNVEVDSSVKAYADTEVVGRGPTNVDIFNDIEVNIDLDVTMKLNANTVILDLAKFTMYGFAYEMEHMKEYLKNMPEYKYGDIIDFEPKPYPLRGRQYIEYEEPLLRDGIIRHLNDVTYHLDDRRYFTWAKDSQLNFTEETLISKTYFLASMARESGMKDNVYIATRSDSTTILDEFAGKTQYRGNQKIEESPYQKEVQGQVDIGQNIVLVNYDHGDYLVMKLDNIYIPYIKYLEEIGVVKSSELVDNLKDSYSRLEGSTVYDLMRLNYNDIYRTTPIINEDSNKDWDWEKEQVTFRVREGGIEGMAPFSRYFRDFQQLYYNDDKDTHEYLVEYEGSHNNYRKYHLKAQVPKLTQDEEITVMEALQYLYKYVWYRETELTLNKLEVDTVMSLYGLKFSNYTEQEIETLKYLIAKGIVDPYQDNLETMRKPLTYKDLVKYLYRLNYPEKRFNFKNLTLTGEDVRMANLGYVRDSFTLVQSYDEEFENAKSDAIKQMIEMESTLGYDRILIELPKEHVSQGNYSLTSSKDRTVVFELSMMEVGSKAYGISLIPRSFTNSLSLRSTDLLGGYSIELESWEDKGIYGINYNSSKYELLGYDSDGTTGFGSTISTKRFASGREIQLQVDPEKEFTYLGTPVFVGEPGDRKLNLTEFGNQMELRKDTSGSYRLVIKDVSTMNELNPILANITPPLSLSSSEETFMGYSVISKDGKKISMIRDVDMVKLGIEIIEDNVLYNRQTDTYGYLDLRTHTLYYGNSIIRYKPGTVMIEGLVGQESAFYNLDIAKTMLRLVDNNSIAHEILRELPPDEEVTVKDMEGYQYDTFLIHDDLGYAGSKWINTSSMGRKNSNLIFYRDQTNDLNLLINYRVTNRGVKTNKNVVNDNNFLRLIDSLKASSLNIHPTMNPLMQKIMNYEGDFTGNNYNYGVTVLLERKVSPSAPTEVRQKILQSQKEKALFALLNMLTSDKEKKDFIGSVQEISHFAGIRIPVSEIKEINEGDEFSEERVIEMVNISEYHETAKESLEQEDLKGTIFLSSQEVFVESVKPQEDKNPTNDLPAKILNNNLYIRFRNYPTFKDVENSQPYRFLGSITYLYSYNEEDKSLRIEDEKVRYENTSAGYIPLESWNANYPIGDFALKDKIVLELNVRGGDNNLKPYIFDRIKPVKYKEGVTKISFTPSKNLEGLNALREVYSELEKYYPEFKLAMDSNILKDTLLKDDTSLRKFLSKSIEGSSNYNSIKEIGEADGTGGGVSPNIWSSELNTSIHVPLQDRLEGETWLDKLKVQLGNALTGTSNKVQDLWGKITNKKILREEDILNKDFKLDRGTLYIIDPLYLMPSGTALVEVGADQETALKLKDNNYRITIAPNEKPRTILGDTFDVLNQNLSHLNPNTELVEEIPEGSRLVLPTGVTLYAMGDNNFIMTVGKALGSAVENEEVLLWRYLENLNVKVGTSLNLLNSVNSIRIPREEDILGKSRTKFLTLVGKNKVVYISEGNIATGSLNEKEGLIRDSSIDNTSYTFPIVTLDGKVTVSKVLVNKDKENVYLIKDVNSSVDIGFVDYLKEGIVDVKVPLISKIDLFDLNIDNDLVKAMGIKTLLTQLNKAWVILKMMIPLFLFTYGALSLIFISLYMVPSARLFMERLIPDNITVLLFKTFTLFSIDDLMDMNAVSGIFKSVLLMVIAVTWWTFQK